MGHRCPCTTFVRSAAIAAEDSRFCSHWGFDLEAIGKAVERNRQGRKLRGGSTISQQTAKNAFLWQGRSWVRKGLEAWFTVLIERSEEHTSELQSLMRIPYDVFFLKKKNRHKY